VATRGTLVFWEIIASHPDPTVMQITIVDAGDWRTSTPIENSADLAHSCCERHQPSTFTIGCCKVPEKLEKV
jgi:hypothetical protein